MAFISDEQQQQLRKVLEEMSSPVKLVHFTQETNVEHARETREMLEELCALSEKLSLEIYNLQIDREKAAAWKVERAPSTAVAGRKESKEGKDEGEKDFGIRFYGFPLGYEFSSLVEAILSVSKGDSGLGATSKEALKKVTAPLHLEVFVTPT